MIPALRRLPPAPSWIFRLSPWETMRLPFRLALSLTILSAAAAFCCTGCSFVNRLKNITQTSKTDEKPAPNAHATYRLPPYVFIADFEIDRKLPLFRELADLRIRLCRQLKLPESDKLVKIHLFKTRESYREYMHEKYPTLPPRRAFFVAHAPYPFADEELMVFTWWGDQKERDLRHETTHALLHSTLLDVPLWLDEGLAEYFETPDADKGVHHRHLQQIQTSGMPAFRPDMNRLEKLTKVDEMKAPEYREAWAWVHFMLHGNKQARKVLLDYLQELRTTDKPGPLRPRLEAVVPSLDAELISHLAALKSNSDRSGKMSQ